MVGSAQTPAILWLLVAVMVSSASLMRESTVWWELRHRLGYCRGCTLESLGVGGAQVPTLVSEQALPATPWQDLLKAQTCSLPVQSLASMCAKSLASLPELQRQATSNPSPRYWHSCLQYSPWYSCRQMGEMCMSFLTWSVKMALRRGWQCPTLTVEMPPARSMNSLPVSSQRYWRWPRTAKKGSLQQGLQKGNMCWLWSLSTYSREIPWQGSGLKAENLAKWLVRDARHFMAGRLQLQIYQEVQLWPRTQTRVNSIFCPQACPEAFPRNPTRDASLVKKSNRVTAYSKSTPWTCYLCDGLNIREQLLTQPNPQDFGDKMQ